MIQPKPKPLLYRATSDFEITKRELDGIALVWDRASTVTDDGGRTYYREAFTPTSATKTLKERAAVPLPLGLEHPWQVHTDWDNDIASPVGHVRFRAMKDGLMFRAKVLNTPEGDEVLGQLQDGTLGDVSVGFVSHKSTLKDGVTWREQIALYEMSLAQPGRAQHTGARVLSVRTKPNASYRDITEFLLFYT